MSGVRLLPLVRMHPWVSTNESRRFSLHFANYGDRQSLWDVQATSGKCSRRSCGMDRGQVPCFSGTYSF